MNQRVKSNCKSNCSRKRFCDYWLH